MASLGIVIVLGLLLAALGLAAGLAILIGNSLRVRDMRFPIAVVIGATLLGFLPFVYRTFQLENVAYALPSGDLVSADKVEDGKHIESKQPVTERLLNYRQVLPSGEDVVLATDKNIKIDQRWAFRPEHWKDAVKFGIDLAGGTNLIYEAKPLNIGEPLTSEVMTRLVGAVTRRVNPSGTNEVVVRQVGQNRIEIIVPGADPAAVAEVKDRITRLGSLEFMIVANISDHGPSHTKSTFDIISAAKANPDETYVRDPADGTIVAQWMPVAPLRDENGIESPNLEDFQLSDSSIAVRQRTNKPAGYYEVLLLVLPADQRVTGQYLRESKPTMDTEGRPAVNFRFDSEGSHRFETLTRENKKSNAVDRRLAVVLDGELHSAPSIAEVISSNGIIHGRFTDKQVNELVSVLNAGALPVELVKEPVSEFTISPTLGADVQQKGLRALWISAIAVVAFMGGYYLIAGAVADYAMLLNLLFIAAAMAILDAAFTLPGLAGLVLGAGMAVDANVLIYERIREEQQRGASLRMAIHNGFDRASGAIIDSNLTTMITGGILYAIGTEQVKGFAVALVIGLIMNLFTAVFVSRVVLTVLEKSRLVKGLPMLQVIGKTNIDFLKHGWVASIASIVLIVAGLAAFSSRGRANYDIDFNGGTMVTMLFNADIETDAVRQSLAKVQRPGTDITLERLTLPGDVVTGTLGRRFRLRTTEPDQKLVEQQIIDTFPGKLVQHDLEYGQIAAIPKPPARKDAEEQEPAEKTDAPRDAKSERFAGGHDVVLSVTSKNEPVDTAPSTISRYLANELAKTGLEQPETLFELVGTAGTGTTAEEGQVRLFSKYRLLVSPSVTQEQLATSLASAEKAMESKPVFDEVTSFATSVASETKMWAVIAILLSLVATIIYIWFRFETWAFGVAAVVAVAHDVLVAIGCMALASYLALTPIGPLFLLTDFKINMAIIAAFLTIVGFSLNDTIVIFDRIREIRGKAPRVTYDMINLAVNQTLSRSILTSFTVFMTVLILYIFGGEGIHGFAFTMLIGVVAGSYSTIFIANPIALWILDRFITVPAPAARFGKPQAA